MKLRGVMLLLACLNIGAGLWWWLQPQPAPQALPQAEGVPVLALMSEVPELPTLPSDSGRTGICLTLGPFAEAEAMRDAMARLTPVVARIQMRELPESRLIGYRVFLPPAASRDAAMETARQLVARGIRDYYLVSAGEQQNAISLGMFRDLGNAERRRDELRAAGFAPQLEPRSEDGLQWWIDFEAEEGFDWRPVLPAASAVEAQPRPCQPDPAPPVVAPADGPIDVQAE